MFLLKLCGSRRSGLVEKMEILSPKVQFGMLQDLEAQHCHYCEHILWFVQHWSVLDYGTISSKVWYEEHYYLIHEKESSLY